MPKLCSGVARWAYKSSWNIPVWLWREPRMNWGESLNSGLLQQSRWFVCICPFGKSGSLEMYITDLFLGCSSVIFLCLRNVWFCTRTEKGRGVCIYLVMHLSFPWQACLYMREYSKSRNFLARAQCIQPFNRDINNELKKLARWEPSFPYLGKRECLNRLQYPFQNILNV